jgi:hypothetical protein
VCCARALLLKRLSNAWNSTPQTLLKAEVILHYSKQNILLHVAFMMELMEAREHGTQPKCTLPQAKINVLCVLPFFQSRLPQRPNQQSHLHVKFDPSPASH